MRGAYREHYAAKRRSRERRIKERREQKAIWLAESIEVIKD